MSQNAPTIRVGEVARVRVRDADDGTALQAIGLAACFGSENAFLSVRVTDVEQTERGHMLLRLGAGSANFLLRRLREICASAFGAEDPTLESRSPRAPGPRDDTYVPGEPWRRGRWIAPMPKAGRH